MMGVDFFAGRVRFIDIPLLMSSDSFAGWVTFIFF